MQKKYTHIVSQDYIGQDRICDYAVNLFPNLQSKNAVKKAIKNNNLLIDNQTCTTGTFVKPGQTVEYRFKNITNIKEFRLKLDVIFEDDYLAVVNKPAGITVSGNAFKTLANALTFNLKKSTNKDALPFPLPVHRLDNQTSGLVIVAKTIKSRIKLGEQFEDKCIKKTYFAVVIGKTQPTGIINSLVNGKKAISKFELIRTESSLRNGFLSLIKLYPETGRTHQLRIHCEASGFPILGDKIYHGNKPVFKGKGLFLSSTDLTFTHPIYNKILKFNISYPIKFDRVIDRENKRFILEKG